MADSLLSATFFFNPEIHPRELPTDSGFVDTLWKSQ